MRIGQLAREAGVDVQTIRYYEREALLSAPPRSAAGYRAYGPAHLRRLKFIRHCRSLDMPLAEIRRLIELSVNEAMSCDDVGALVRTHLDRVRQKRQALQAIEDGLTALSAQCAAGRRVADCGILEELVHAAQAQA